MTRSHRIAALLAAALTAASLGAAGPAPDAHASGGAPVTQPDSVTGYPNNYVFVRVLANDSDPEGDRLAVCGLTPPRHQRLRADFDNPREVAVGLGGRAKPGTYTFTYYACDGTSQTPGTLTVVVAEPPRIKVRPVPGRPGQVRATSRAPFGIRLSVGNALKGDLDSVVSIPKRGSVVFGTRYHRLDWVARRPDGTFLRRGHVEHVP